MDSPICKALAFGHTIYMLEATRGQFNDIIKIIKKRSEDAFVFPFFSFYMCLFATYAVKMMSS